MKEVKDWEQELTSFLQRIERGEDEASVSEELIEYVLELARDEYAKGYMTGRAA